MLHPEGPVLRALKLLLADGALTVRGGETFCGVRPFFYENDRSSEMKSRKINAMEGKEPVIDKIWGPIAKKRISWPKSEFIGPKKEHLFTLTMF